MTKAAEIAWDEQPEDDDYLHAFAYLSLIYPPKEAVALVDRLREAPMVSVKAKNVVRASGIEPLDSNNIHCHEDLRKIRLNQPLVPVLLLRDPVHGRVIICEGFHRVSSAYRWSEDSTIRCKLA